MPRRIFWVDDRVFRMRDMFEAGESIKGLCLRGVTEASPSSICVYIYIFIMIIIVIIMITIIAIIKLYEIHIIE